MGPTPCRHRFRLGAGRRSPRDLRYDALVASPLLAPSVETVDRSEFLPATDRVLRRFLITHRHPDLTPEEADLLGRFASCAEPQPCSTPLAAGRTIYSRSAEAGSLAKRGIRGVKSKGIQGLTALSETSFQQVRPSPDRSYSDFPRVHLMLDEHLRLQVVGSGLKALHSLLETGAANEYRFQQALASVDAGLAALLAVRFGTHDTPEFDCFDRGTRTRRTGGVFLAHDADATTVAARIRFIWHRLSHGPLTVRRPASGHLSPACDLEDLVANFVAIYQKVAQVNARAILEAGVARHASVTTNFLINQFSERVYQTDLDSCLDMRDLPDNLRGPQVIRDVSSALVKMTTSLCLCALSEDLMALLSGPGAVNIFNGVLQAYFGAFAGSRDIDDTAIRLQHRLVRYLTDRPRTLCAQKELYVLADAAGHHETSQYHQDLFRFIMEPFHKDCILELYGLLKGSRFEAAGYALPTISPKALNRQLFSGLMTYRAAVMCS